MNLPLKGRQGRVLAGFAFAIALSTGSGAFAQNCATTATGPGASLFGGQLQAAAAAGGAAAGSFAGTLGNMSTAFLSQQGSAFVSAPGDPKPYQPGGGVWIRGVGGGVTNKFTSNATVPLERLLTLSIPRRQPSARAVCARPLPAFRSGRTLLG